MTYRRATPDDATTLAAMNRQLIDDEGHRNPMDVDALAERIRGWLARGEYIATLFIDDAAPVGYALWRRDDDHVYLRQFFVARSHRRQGLGRAAIAALRAGEWADAPRVRLDVLVNNAAGRAFWRSVGFADYCVTMEATNG